LHVFNFAILLKSRKFDARERYMFYSIGHTSVTSSGRYLVTVCCIQQLARSLAQLYNSCFVALRFCSQCATEKLHCFIPGHICNFTWITAAFERRNYGHVLYCAI